MIKGYLMAVYSTAVALIVALILRPQIELNAFNLFLGSVFVSVLYGGLGPGLTASFLSILAMSFFFLPPYFDFRFSWMDGGIDLLVFSVLTIVVSSLSARLKDANQKLARAHSTEFARRMEAEQALLEVSHREQRRMGQDLHDGLCQTLAGARFVAESLNDCLAERNLPEKAYVDQMEDLLGQALAQADAVSRGLYPVELEANGLEAALQELCKNMSKNYATDCRFICRQAAFVLQNSTATHLFRISQEAIVNAIKSGKAKTVTVRLFSFGQRLLLTVIDDGVGFNPKTMRKGMGLKIMDYRARVINASFVIRSRKRRGTLAACLLQAIAPEKEVLLGR